VEAAGGSSCNGPKQLLILQAPQAANNRRPPSLSVSLLQHLLNTPGLHTQELQQTFSKSTVGLQVPQQAHPPTSTRLTVCPACAAPQARSVMFWWLYPSSLQALAAAASAPNRGAWDTPRLPNAQAAFDTFCVWWVRGAVAANRQMVSLEHSSNRCTCISRTRTKPSRCACVVNIAVKMPTPCAAYTFLHIKHLWQHLSCQLCCPITNCLHHSLMLVTLLQDSQRQHKDSSSSSSSIRCLVAQAVCVSLLSHMKQHQPCALCPP
jgi:hypothetical protein